MLVQGLDNCCSLMHLHHLRTQHTNWKNHRGELLRQVQLYPKRSMVVVLGAVGSYDITRKALRSLAWWKFGRGTSIYAKKLFTLPTTKGEVWIIVNP